jgi:acyl carrier protein phosphodiesterase
VNFLAHCLIPEVALIDCHPDLLAGGFFGDFVKGAVDPSLPLDLANGIRLHRRLDAFSNQLPAIRTSCDRFPAELRRFAPIFVDVVADHVLARTWERHHDTPLPHFSARAYAAIGAHLERLPAAGQRFYDHARRHDLFARYGDPATLHGSLTSVASRLDRAWLAPPAIAAIERALPALTEDFEQYFPLLIAHAGEWLAARGYTART